MGWSNSVLVRMPLTDDLKMSWRCEKVAFSPTIQLYFRLAASTNISSSLKYSSYDTNTSSPGFEDNRLVRSSQLLPISSPLPFISYKKPFVIPSGTLKFSIWSFHIGGNSRTSYLNSVCNSSSPMVSRTATLLSPCFLLMVALSKRKVSSAAGSYSKVA